MKARHLVATFLRHFKCNFQTVPSKLINSFSVFDLALSSSLCSALVKVASNTLFLHGCKFHDEAFFLFPLFLAFWKQLGKNYFWDAKYQVKLMRCALKLCMTSVDVCVVFSLQKRSRRRLRNERQLRADEHRRRKNAPHLPSDRPHQVHVHLRCTYMYMYGICSWEWVTLSWHDCIVSLHSCFSFFSQSRNSKTCLQRLVFITPGLYIECWYSNKLCSYPLNRRWRQHRHNNRQWRVNGNQQQSLLRGVRKQEQVARHRAGRSLQQRPSAIALPPRSNRRVQGQHWGQPRRAVQDSHRSQRRRPAERLVCWKSKHMYIYWPGKPSWDKSHTLNGQDIQHILEVIPSHNACICWTVELFNFSFVEFRYKRHTMSVLYIQWTSFGTNWFIGDINWENIDFHQKSLLSSPIAAQDDATCHTGSVQLPSEPLDVEEGGRPRHVARTACRCAGKTTTAR